MPKSDRSNSFRISNLDSAPVATRTPLLMVTPLAAAESAPVVVVVIVVVAGSLSAANRPLAGKAKLLRSCRNTR